MERHIRKGRSAKDEWAYELLWETVVHNLKEEGTGS